MTDEQITLKKWIDESNYIDTYSDTEENLGDIHNGDTEDGKQNIYSNGN